MATRTAGPGERRACARRGSTSRSPPGLVTVTRVRDEPEPVGDRRGGARPGAAREREARAALDDADREVVGASRTVTNSTFAPASSAVGERDGARDEVRARRPPGVGDDDVGVADDARRRPSRASRRRATRHLAHVDRAPGACPLGGRARSSRAAAPASVATSNVPSATRPWATAAATRQRSPLPETSARRAVGVVQRHHEAAAVERPLDAARRPRSRCAGRTSASRVVAVEARRAARAQRRRGSRCPRRATSRGRRWWPRRACGRQSSSCRPVVPSRRTRQGSARPASARSRRRRRPPT